MTDRGRFVAQPDAPTPCRTTTEDLARGGPALELAIGTAASPCRSPPGACGSNVAAHLTDDGVFAVEAFTPGYLHRLQEDQYVLAEGLGLDEVRLDVARLDLTRQLLEKNHVAFGPSGIGFNPIVLRYVWPSELDLMARIAGLRLKERWAGWHREAFTTTSRAHVSVYGS